MQKNATIVYSKIPQTYWGFNHAIEFPGKRSSFPPLGALTIASLFPKNKWNVRVVDENVKPLQDEDIKKSDYMMFSAMEIQKASTAQAIQRAKSFGKPTIIGGPIVSTHCLESKMADVRVEGEAEMIIPGLLEDLLEGRAKEHYKSCDRPDISSVPLPRWDLIDMKQYSSMAIQTSRGCPFDCDFCDITKIYGRVPRMKGVEQVVKELDHLYKWRWRGPVFIVDDNFIGNLPMARKILPEIEKWQMKHGFPYNLFTEASLNIPEDVIRSMYRAGFKKIFVGIETPVQESLKDMRKTQNMRGDMSEKIEMIQRNGIEVMGGFIIGLDKDPENIFDLQNDFIDHNGIVLGMAGLLSAIPGTDLYKRFEREGRLLPGWSGNNTDGELNFVPVLDREFLKRGYSGLMHKLYSPKELYARATTFLERAKNVPPRGNTYITKGDVRAVVKSIWKQGVVDKDRREYWKFIGNAALNYTNRINEAFTFAIMGYHFRKVNEEYLKVA